jgi:hypothetical protein
VLRSRRHFQTIQKQNTGNIGNRICSTKNAWRLFYFRCCDPYDGASNNYNIDVLFIDPFDISLLVNCWHVKLFKQNMFTYYPIHPCYAPMAQYSAQSNRNLKHENRYPQTGLSTSHFRPSHFHHIKLWSASELYRSSDRRLSAKLVPTFADRWCHVVSATDPHGR